LGVVWLWGRGGTWRGGTKGGKERDVATMEQQKSMSLRVVKFALDLDIIVHHIPGKSYVLRLTWSLTAKHSALRHLYCERQGT
jgi:hypothetical protein